MMGVNEWPGRIRDVKDGWSRCGRCLCLWPNYFHQGDTLFSLRHFFPTISFFAKLFDLTLTFNEMVYL